MPGKKSNEPDGRVMFVESDFRAARLRGYGKRATEDDPPPLRIAPEARPLQQSGETTEKYTAAPNLLCTRDHCP